MGKEVDGFNGPLDVHLKKYQDPNQADPMTKVQNELEETKIYYIGLKGEFFQASRVGVVNAVYEARALKEDHKQDIKDLGVSSNNPQF